MKIYTTAALLISLSFSSFATDKGVYGVDTRTDINDSNDSSVKELAKSVAAMIPRNFTNSWEGKTYFANVNLADSL